MEGLFKSQKKFAFIILFILSLISIAFIVGQVSNNKRGIKNAYVPQNLTQATYKSIIPGVSTKEDVVSKLGKPLNSDSGLLEFKSLSPNRNNEVSINQNTVSLIKQIVTLKDTTRASDIIKEYGVAEKILYGGDASAGFYLFVYPKNGIAYLGEPQSGLLLEIWYFPPTDLNTFIISYAKGYSEKLQEPKPENFN